jgi:HSP20 family protein
MTDTSKAINVQKSELTRNEPDERMRDRRVYVPRSDIYETDRDIILIADVPGCDEQSIEVSVEKNILKISGLVEPKVYEGQTLAYSEYHTGDYQRIFTLSDEIDREHIEATVKNGVLKLVLPKGGPARMHKITVKPV